MGLSRAFGHASAGIYAARAEAGGVVHAHPPSCVCLTQIGEPHRVVHNQGGIFADGVPEYSRVGLIRTRELGDLLAQVVGKGNSAMMRGHGITTVFPDAGPSRPDHRQRRQARVGILRRRRPRESDRLGALKPRVRPNRVAAFPGVLRADSELPAGTPRI